MEQWKSVVWIRQGLKVLFWLGVVVFFIDSFQKIMELEGLITARRIDTLSRILNAFSKPNLDGETILVVTTIMWETVQIGFLATAISAILAFPVTFLSARPSSWWGRGFDYLLQPLLAAVRAVHPLYLAIFAITFAGFGSMAGVLAITFLSTAVMIGRFSEYAQKRTSLSWVALLKRYFPGLAFKHLPVNILIATVIGFVGGGGIGFFLQQSIYLLSYSDASTGILACIIVIGSLDLISQAVWRKIQASA